MDQKGFNRTNKDIHVYVKADIYMIHMIFRMLAAYSGVILKRLNQIMLSSGVKAKINPRLSRF